MKRRTAVLLIVLCAAGCLRTAYAEFGTGFGGAGSLFSESFDAAGSADSCLGALALVAAALVIDLIRMGIVGPVYQFIHDRWYSRRAREAAALRQEDPAFDPGEVAAWAQNLYMRLQREWEQETEKGDVFSSYLTPVADELGENLLYKNCERLEKLNGKGIGRHSACIRFIDVSVIGWFGKRKKTVLDLKMNLERMAWYTNKKGGYIGKTPEVAQVCHIWRFKRPAGARTPAEKTVCACGEACAPLYGECPHCGTRLKRPEDAWKLEKIIEGKTPEIIARMMNKKRKRKTPYSWFP